MLSRFLGLRLGIAPSGLGPSRLSFCRKTWALLIIHQAWLLISFGPLSFTFPPLAIGRFLVIPQAKKGGLAQLAVSRPFSERNLGNQPRAKIHL